MPVSHEVSQNPFVYAVFWQVLYAVSSCTSQIRGCKKVRDRDSDGCIMFMQLSGALGSVDRFKNDRRGAPLRCPATLRGLTMRLLRIEETERCLGVSKSSIYRLIRDGHFDVVKIGHLVRITDESLNAYITSHTTFGTAVER